MAVRDPKALLLRQLKDIYCAENAIVKALHDMMEAAWSEDVKVALGVHPEESRSFDNRLEQVFEALGEKQEGVECKVIQGYYRGGDRDHPRVRRQRGFGCKSSFCGPSHRALRDHALRHHVGLG